MDQLGLHTYHVPKLRANYFQFVLADLFKKVVYKLSNFHQLPTGTHNGCRVIKVNKTLSCNQGKFLCRTMFNIQMMKTGGNFSAKNFSSFNI